MADSQLDNQIAGRTLAQYIEQAIHGDSRNRTIEQIAKAARIDASYLSRIKRGSLIPGPAVLEALIRELNLDAPEARKLAEQGSIEKRAQTVRRRVTLLQQAFEATAFPDRNQVTRIVYGGFLSAARAAAARNNRLRVLVVDAQNGASEISMDVLNGPDISVDGKLHFQLHVPNEKLPAKFLLDLIFLFAVPSPDSVSSVELGPKEIRLLRGGLGYRYSANLPVGPGLEELIERVRSRQEGSIAVRVGSAFAFRIRSL
jgi:transcriptional regulator with XRE-family HTH domain